LRRVGFDSEDQFMPPVFLARRFVAHVAVAVIGFGWFTVSAHAADTAPEPLRQAVRAAWADHPSHRATEAQLAAARARLDAAGQPLYNPELQLSRDDETVERTDSAGLALTLDVSGKRRVRRDAAAARVEVADAEAQMRRRDFARQWIGAWAELEAARQRVATGERRLALVNRFADLAEKQFVADDISGLERDLALLARDEAQAEQAQWLAELAAADAAFRSVGGDPATLTPLALTPDSLPAPAAEAADVRDTPDWRAAQASAQAAAREVAVAQRNRIADPTVSAYRGRKEYLPGGPSDPVYGVSVSIPLHVRNSYRAEVVAAQADADAAQAEFDRVQLTLTNDRRRAIDSFAAARNAWSAWQRSRGTDVDRRADLLERLWREGELSTADYLLQLKQTLDTQLAGAELRARVWRTYLDYLAATGQLERWSGLEATP
jgi:cobalt-zinc-cadmium efflux system outer membrane protein